MKELDFGQRWFTDCFEAQEPEATYDGNGNRRCGSLSRADEATLGLYQQVYKSIDTYHAARYSWLINPAKAEQAEYVMAVFHGAIVRVFEADEWFPANEKYFPDLPNGHGNWSQQSNGFGFVGRSAPKEIERTYSDKRVPKQWAFTGNSIRSVNF